MPVVAQGNFYYQGKSAFDHLNLDLIQFEKLEVMLRQLLALLSHVLRERLFQVLVEIHSRCQGMNSEGVELCIDRKEAVSRSKM